MACICRVIWLTRSAELETQPDAVIQQQEQAKADRGAQTAENIRYEQTISEGGMGGKTTEAGGNPNQGSLYSLHGTNGRQRRHADQLYVKVDLAPRPSSQARTRPKKLDGNRAMVLERVSEDRRGDRSGRAWCLEP